MALLLDGKSCAQAVRSRLKAEISRLAQRGMATPHILFIQVGENPASTSYVNSKQVAAEKAGMRSTVQRLPESTRQSELLGVIEAANRASDIHGILVQLPLPPWIDSTAVAQSISPGKDVDCFHPENMGRLVLGLPGPKPATPQGILMLLEHHGIEVAGRLSVVVGRSNLVGKPLCLMLLQADATVVMCHSRTPDLASLTRQADLLVSAVGRPSLICASMVKAGSTVVDVGINFIPGPDAAGSSVLCGDVDFAGVSTVAGAISPVPGGVGPMTIASVLCNGLALYEASHHHF